MKQCMEMRVGCEPVIGVKQQQPGIAGRASQLVPLTLLRTTRSLPFFQKGKRPLVGLSMPLLVL
jgi:hypothetical protein